MNAAHRTLLTRATSGGGGGGTTPVNPDSVTGLVGRWAAADITGHVDGDTITTWNVSAGSLTGGYYTGSGSVLYKTGIVNALPVLRFDGSTGTASMFGPSNSSPGLTTVVTAICVVAAANATTGGSIFDSSTSANVNRLMRNSTTTWDGFAGAFIHSGATTPQAWHVVTMVRDGTNTGTSIIGVDNAEVTGTFSNSTNAGALNLSPTATKIAMDLAEICVFSSTLSAANRKGVAKYLGNKYGLTVA